MGLGGVILGILAMMNIAPVVLGFVALLTMGGGIDCYRIDDLRRRVGQFERRVLEELASTDRRLSRTSTRNCACHSLSYLFHVE